MSDDETLAPHRQNERALWPLAKQRMAEVFATRTRAEWEGVFEGSDACFAPVLEPGEVAHHPHTRERSTTVEINGVLQAQAAPRFSRTPASAGVPCHPGQHDVDDVLHSWS